MKRIVRVAPRAPLVLLGMLLVASHASASIELPEGRHVEKALIPGTEASFRVPLAITQEGSLYAKILVTPGNAVNDGTPNGSAAGDGWAVGFALARENGVVSELGTFFDSTPTEMMPVSAGEAPTLLVKVRIPEDAAKGGPSQTVYVAIVHRLTSPDPGSTSGARLDDSRSIVLHLTNALIPVPPVEGPEPAPEEPTPAEPVGPIEERPTTIVVEQRLPTWFLVGALALGVAILLLLVLVIVLAANILRELRIAPRERRVEVRAPGRGFPDDKEEIRR